MLFKEFRNLIKTQVDYLAKHSVCLFTLSSIKEELWETYIESYRKEDNQIVNENRHYDCNCCKSFIRKYANIAGIVKGELITVWDVPVDVPQPFDVVVTAMQNYLKDKKITGKFLHDEDSMGTMYNMGTTSEKMGNRYEHFYAITPAFCKSNNIATDNGAFVQAHQVIQRSLKELTIESVNLVLDIINDGNLARGEQMRPQLEKFKSAYDTWSQSQNTELLEWEFTQIYGRSIAIRNTAIGTLLQDLSEGMDVAKAIFRYNNKIDPANYKRVKAIFTEKQRQDASAKIKALGYENSLEGRHAELRDISINNVFWANREAKQLMNDPLALLNGDVTTKVSKKGSKEININEFLSLLPTVKNLEVMFENRHESHLMNLLTQKDSDSPTVLQWNNTFRWSYNGDLTGTSSLREKVAELGGRVNGAFRFSHSWNELEKNQSLMDLHVFMPGCKVPMKGGGPNITGRRVGWNNRKDHLSGGKQDVDYTQAAPTDYIPVENITFPSISKMPEGVYTCKIHNWAFRSTGGKGRAEIEFNNQIFKYVYPATKNHEWITIAEITLKDGLFTIKHLLQPEDASKVLWKQKTKQYHKVSTFMLSPNYWNGQKVGNPHYFFFIDGLNNPNSCRAIYNEFLNNDFKDHKRIFEMLGSKLRVPSSENQLAGLGFTVDENHKLNVKLDGRPYSINFTGKLVSQEFESQAVTTI